MNILKKILYFCTRHEFIFAAGSIAIITVLFLPGRDSFDKAQWALLYLPVIVMAAGVSGFHTAAVAAVAAFFAWDYFFLPPYGTLYVADSKDWISLVVFLVVGISMGYQTAKLREKEARALERARDMKFLNRLTAGMMAYASPQAMADALLQEIVSSVAVRNASMSLSDERQGLISLLRVPEETTDAEDVRTLAAWAFSNNKIVGEMASGGHPFGGEASNSEEGVPHTCPCDILPLSCDKGLYFPMAGSERVEGVVHVGERIDGRLHTPETLRVLRSAASLAATFLERQRFQTIAHHAEIMKEADRLKSALVMSVSHELKTPLAAMTASVTGLLEEGAPREPALIYAELESVSESLSRLSSSINTLLELSQLEGHALEMTKEWNDLPEILATVASDFSRQERDRLVLSLPEDLPLLFVDYRQWRRLFRHILENAFAYSPPDSLVEIGAFVDGNGVIVWVEDRGPGIDATEREHVFEKFYRGRASRNVPGGAGLGLAVAKQIVDIHGGTIRAEKGFSSGARIVVHLPRNAVSKGESLT